MIFEFKIDNRNAAFTGGGDAEVARLLRQVADRIKAGEDCGDLMEFSGNRCGKWFMDNERPDLEDCEAEDLMTFADDFALTLDDDPRRLSRAELVEGLESIGIACYDKESDQTLAAAYGDSMLAGDLPGDCEFWRRVCVEAWEQ
jgi:hypothetical protein